MILSIIVPVHNEIAQLPRLFDTLSGQKGITFEVLLMDGGSTDGSFERATELAAQASFPCRVSSSQKGRGRQLNLGVKLSSGESLLFLHADSQFVDGMALKKALNCFQKAIQSAGHFRIAGHFSLRFQRESSKPYLGFYYLESKARLDRPGCIHGDQGYLLQRCFFDQIGPFDESLGFLEDNRLAQSVRDAGFWVLLPVELRTSSRRFAQEGFRQRQVLNALVMNLEALGRDEWLRGLPDIYRQQDHVQELHLLPFFQEIDGRLSELSKKEQQKFWYQTGNYLVANTWQLAFLLDVKRAFHRGLCSGVGRRTVLRVFDRCLYPLIDHSLSYWFASLLVHTWFRSQLKDVSRSQ